MKKNRSIRVTPSSRVIKDGLDESLCVEVSYEKLSLFRTGITKMGFRNPDGLMQHSTVKSTAYDVVKAYVDSKVGKFMSAEIITNCPSASRASVLASLKKMTETGYLIRIKTGRSVTYVCSSHA